MRAAKPLQSELFIDSKKRSSPRMVLFRSPSAHQENSADLTIAVLGRLTLWSYYPDTLLALADKIQPKPLSDCRRADLTGLLSCGRAGTREKALWKVHETKTHHPLR